MFPLFCTVFNPSTVVCKETQKRWKCRWRDLLDAVKMAVARTEMGKRSGDVFFFFFLSTYRPARCIAFYCNSAACQSPRSSKIPLSCCQNPDTRRYWLLVFWAFLDHCTSSRFWKRKRRWLQEDDRRECYAVSASFWQTTSDKFAKPEDRYITSIVGQGSISINRTICRDEDFERSIKQRLEKYVSRGKLIELKTNVIVVCWNWQARFEQMWTLENEKSKPRELPNDTKTSRRRRSDSLCWFVTRERNRG